jgi:hypothetical protein
MDIDGPQCIPGILQNYLRTIEERYGEIRNPFFKKLEDLVRGNPRVFAVIGGK